MISPMEQLIGFVEFEKTHNPGRVHIAQWALSRIESLEADKAGLQEQLRGWLAENGPGGWIDAQRNENARLLAAIASTKGREQS